MNFMELVSWRVLNVVRLTELLNKTAFTLLGSATNSLVKPITTESK